MKNRIIILLVIFGVLSIVSCEDSVCNEILQELNSLDCNNKECQLDLKNLFNEEWDQLFVFHGFNTPKDISNAIGFEYNGNAIYDHNRLILQIADGEVLKSTTTECLNLNFDRVLKNGYYKKESNDSVVKLIISEHTNKSQYTIIN